MKESVTFGSDRNREWWKNLWHAKELPECLAKVPFRVDVMYPSCPSCGYRDGILPNRVIFVFPSCDHRCRRACFPHEGNTKEIRSCLIALGRQHDAVKPSQFRRVAIVLWYDGIWMGPQSSRRQPNSCR